MSANYKFRIADTYTPETLPMERLAEYMTALARLLGEPNCVHFEGVRDGSAVLVANVDVPAQSTVRERVQLVRIGAAPKDALKAASDLEELLRKDSATGALIDDEDAVVIPFPGRLAPAPAVFGPFKQDGSLEGQVIRVGGKDDTVPVHLRDGDDIHTGLSATPELAKRIAQHIFGRVLRVHGTGTWFRDIDGNWVLRSFKVDDFEVLDDYDLETVVAKLRSVKGSSWGEVKDPVEALLRERHGNGGTG